MKTLLRQLLAEQSEQSTLLVDGSETLVQVISNNIMNFRIPAKGNPTPCRIFIEYSEGTSEQEKKNLTAYVSLEQQQPTKDNCLFSK